MARPSPCTTKMAVSICLQTKLIGFLMSWYLPPDYRVGRNLARTLLQYYRFINILPMPIVTEVRSKRRGRNRHAHHSRSRSKTRYEVKPRPKTPRCHAPIAYTNLSICYDSGGGGGSSDEGGFSPARPLAPGSSCFSGYRNYRRAATASCSAHPGHDQYSPSHWVP